MNRTVQSEPTRHIGAFFARPSNVLCTQVGRTTYGSFGDWLHNAEAPGAKTAQNWQAPLVLRSRDIEPTPDNQPFCLRYIPSGIAGAKGWTMTLGQFTETKLLVPHLEFATKATALVELSKRLAAAGRVESADAFLSTVLDHDMRAPAVFEAVAIALARGQLVKELSFALGLSAHAIRWDVAGAPAINAVFL